MDWFHWKLHPKKEGNCSGRSRVRRILLTCIQMLLIQFLDVIWSMPKNFAFFQKLPWVWINKLLFWKKVWKTSWILDWKISRGRGKNWSAKRKISRNKGENQQPTQLTYGIDTGIQTQAKLMRGKYSHHCAILAPIMNKSW